MRASSETFCHPRLVQDFILTLETALLNCFKRKRRFKYCKKLAIKSALKAKLFQKDVMFVAHINRFNPNNFLRRGRCSGWMRWPRPRRRGPSLTWIVFYAALDFGVWLSSFVWSVQLQICFRTHWVTLRLFSFSVHGAPLIDRWAHLLKCELFSKTNRLHKKYFHWASNSWTVGLWNASNIYIFKLVDHFCPSM